MSCENFIYDWNDIDCGDVSKIDHYAVSPDHKIRILIDYTPYSILSNADFKTLATLGFPSRHDLGFKHPIHDNDIEYLRYLIENFNATRENISILMKMSR